MAVVWVAARSGGDGLGSDVSRMAVTVATSPFEYVPGTVVVDQPNYDSAFLAPTDVLGLHQVPGVHDVVEVSSTGVRDGREATWALLEDGTLVGWGGNIDGRLGHGSARPVDAPVVVPGLPPVRSVDSNMSGTYVLAVDGTVWAWGTDGYAVGLPPDHAPHATPQPVPGLSGIIDVTTSSQRCAHGLGSDGTVWTWGTCVGGGAPVAVARVPGAVGITGTTERLVVLLDDGTVWWVASHHDKADAPAQVPGLEGIADVEGTIGNLAAVTVTGDLWHCEVEGISGWTVEKIALHSIVQVSAARKYALDSDGEVWYYDRDYDEGGDGVGRVPNLPPIAFIGGDAFTMTEIFVVGERS